MRGRGEVVERSFAHVYDTGGMRRVHLRNRDNIAKRVLIHAAAFNLSLILRQVLGVGTARSGGGPARRTLWCVLEAHTSRRSGPGGDQTALPVSSARSQAKSVPVGPQPKRDFIYGLLREQIQAPIRKLW